MDPIARASETLAALLFRRGDVAPAPAVTAIPLTDEELLRDDGQGRLPDAVTRLGLATAIGLDDRGGTTSARTSPDTTAIDSETGQIHLDTAAKRMTVATPRTEAAAFATLERPLKIGRMTITSADGPMLIAASALDGRDLAASRKVLLILATDARNSGMRFSDDTERTVLDLGTLPVRIRRGTVTLDLALSGEPARPVTLTTLGLDGSVWSRHAIERRGSALSLRLDNAADPRGPTTFFLLSR